MPGLRAEAEQREQERHRGPERRQVLRAHVGEGVVAGVRLQHAEAQQDADRADVRDQQVEVAGAADLGDAVIGDDEEERRQRHRLPHHHEGVGVVGEHDHRHAGEEDVVLEAEQSGRRAFALAEVAGGEGRDAGRRARRSPSGRRRRGCRGAGGTAVPAARAAARRPRASRTARRARRRTGPARSRRRRETAPWPPTPGGARRGCRPRRPAATTRRRPAPSRDAASAPARQVRSCDADQPRLRGFAAAAGRARAAGDRGAARCGSGGAAAPLGT